MVFLGQTGSISSLGLFANVVFLALFVATYHKINHKQSWIQIAFFSVSYVVCHWLTVQIDSAVESSACSSILLLAFLFGGIRIGSYTLITAFLVSFIPAAWLPFTNISQGIQHIYALVGLAILSYAALQMRSHEIVEKPFFVFAITAVSANAILGALMLLNNFDQDHLVVLAIIHTLQALTFLGLAVLLDTSIRWKETKDRDDKRKRLLDAMLEATEEGFLRLDSNYRIKDCNTSALKLFGAERKGMLEDKDFSLLMVHPDQVTKFKEPTKETIEFLLMTLQGKKFPVRIRSYQVEQDGNPNLGILLTDISLQKRNEEYMSLTQMVFDVSLEGILILDTEYRIIFLNERVVHLTGYDVSDLLGTNPKMLQSTMNPSGFETQALIGLSKDSSWEGDLWIRHKNGDNIPCHARLLKKQNEHSEITHYICVLSDMSDLVKTKEALTQQSQYDSLTQLPNRANFVSRLERELSLFNADQQSMAIAALDIRNFRQVNNSLGHLAGDRLLRLLSARIRELEFLGYRFARLGGDEFLLCIVQDNPQINLYLILDHIASLVKEPFALQGESVYLALSTGITVVIPTEPSGAESLIQQADTALNEARQSKNSYAVFQSNMEEQAIRTLTLSKKLKMAIENNAIEVYYQPKVNLKSQKIEGIEALARWRDVDGKFISPAVFIPLAEQAGIIHPLFQIVLQKTLRDMSQSFLPLCPDLEVSINLSVQQFQLTDLVEQIVRRIDHSGIPRKQITVEITESIFVENFSVAKKTLEKFQEEGIAIALDDFGTRFSSLTYLQHLPVQILKVDKSFVDPLPGDARMCTMMEAVMTLCNGFGLSCVVEGVESAEQLHYIQTLGCQSSQGYLFSPPVEPKRFTSLLMHQNEGKSLFPVEYEPIS